MKKKKKEKTHILIINIKKYKIKKSTQPNSLRCEPGDTVSYTGIVSAHSVCAGSGKYCLNKPSMVAERSVTQKILYWQTVNEILNLQCDLGPEHLTRLFARHFYNDTSSK